MKQKQRIKIAAGIACALAIVLFALSFLPRSIVLHPESAHVSKIIYNGESIKKTIDHATFIGLLAQSKCYRTLDSYFPYRQTDVSIEIDIVDGGRPLHILLGDINFCYESVDKGTFALSDPERLKQSIEKLLLGQLQRSCDF